MNAEARTLPLPGVDVAERRGPTLQLDVTFRYGTHPMIAAADLACLTEALDRVLAKIGATARLR